MFLSRWYPITTGVVVLLLLLCRSLSFIFCSSLVIFLSIFCCYRVANRNTVSSISRCCLVLILLSSYLCFYFLLKDWLSVLQSCRKYFCCKYTLTLCIHPYLKKSKKLRVLMRNKHLCMLLFIVNGNNILIWSWNNQYQISQFTSLPSLDSYKFL